MKETFEVRSNTSRRTTFETRKYRWVCECPEPQPDSIGECGRCFRLVLGASPVDKPAVPKIPRSRLMRWLGQ